MTSLQLLPPLRKGCGYIVAPVLYRGQDVVRQSRVHSHNHQVGHHHVVLVFEDDLRNLSRQICGRRAR
jgi:hypothetical protein